MGASAAVPRRARATGESNVGTVPSRTLDWGTLPQSLDSVELLHNAQGSARLMTASATEPGHAVFAGVGD